MKLARLLFFSLMFGGVASGAVTLQIDSAGWGDTTTTHINGMAWGVIVSSDNTGFGGSFLPDLALALQGFTLPVLAVSSSTPVQIGSSSYYFVRAQSNTSSGPPPTFQNGYMNTVQFNLTSPVATGDPMGLLWFPGGTSEGDFFGFQDLNLNVPTDGFTVTGVSSTSGLATNQIVAIPEPSRALLIGLSSIGLLLQRRRKGGPSC